jgi:hypothetical protein
MVSFRSPASHAGHVMKSLQGDTLRSVGTVQKLRAGVNPRS